MRPVLQISALEIYQMSVFQTDVWFTRKKQVIMVIPEEMYDLFYAFSGLTPMW